MSEIESKVWIDPEYLPSLRHEITGTILKLEKNGSETMPLYTADQLAEAVAAEREQWSATVANALNWLKHGRIANARDDLKAVQRRAVNEAIRSAAK
ncbi:hypothetical protein [Gluconobacter japonicus]|uniref:hypothetical protein n=1 Tax=Gluconobacter japonicus TaxID=376620 RepID=UPI000784FBD8|nr:hypothetical protein [Gluconobacter japonicus]KXV20612.1 hypothetical protein AD935_11020 [Gluconobacter japonicus]